MQGIVKDGWNALARYYLNNFCDGTKQVSMLHFLINVLYTQIMTENGRGPITFQIQHNFATVFL